MTFYYWWDYPNQPVLKDTAPDLEILRDFINNDQIVGARHFRFQAQQEEQ